MSISSQAKKQIAEWVQGQSIPYVEKVGKKQNIFQVLNNLENGGLGAHLAQSRWGKSSPFNGYIEITSVKLKPDGKHGKVRGIKYNGLGVALEKEKKVRGALKHHWVLKNREKLQIPDPS